MRNNYLIPANSKKSQLILGFFTMVDLILFLSGCGITLILLMIIKSPDLGDVVVILLPLLISGFLVLPVPHYHNMLQLLTNIIEFFFGRRKYYWRGWCASNDEETK